MKNVINILFKCFIAAIIAVVVFLLFFSSQSCNKKTTLEYDDNKVLFDSDSISVLSRDKFFYEVDIPTRKIKTTIAIENKSDTDRVFIIKLIEK